LPSRALRGCRGGGPPGVGLEAGEDGVADPPFEAAERFFVDLALGGAVVRGEVIPAGEPGHVGDVADDRAGVDRSEAEDPGERDARGPDGRGQFLLGRAELGIQASQVLQEVVG
jgi:hypothetical protein